MGQVCTNSEKQDKIKNIRPRSELHYVEIQPPKSKISEANQEVARETQLFSPSSVEEATHSAFPSSSIMQEGQKICGSCPKSDSYSGEPESIKSSNDIYNKSQGGSQEQGTGSQLVEPFENFKDSSKVKINRSPGLLPKKELKSHSNLLPGETGGGHELWQTT